MKFAAGVPGMFRFPRLSDPWMLDMVAPKYQRVCRRLEEIGFDSIDCPEHLALDAQLEPVMGPYWPHAMAAMAFCAGATERICVNSSILILPLHHPVNLAKAIATVDVLSGGRVILSVGLGVGEAEFRALGVPYKERGRVADEYLEAMQVLWTSAAPEFRGRYVSFDGVLFEPKPLQRPVPIWIGGNSDPAIRRAVRFGTGWRPSTVGLEELPAYKDKIARFSEALGRDKPVELHIPAGRATMGEDHKDRTDVAPQTFGAAELVDRIGRLAEAGVTWTSLPHVTARSLDEYLDRLEKEHRSILDQCR